MCIAGSHGYKGTSSAASELPERSRDPVHSKAKDDHPSEDKVMGAHPDTWKPWVWAMFAFNTLFGVIFAILSWATFSGFRQIMHTATTVLPAGTDSDAWWWLFDGAAVSAFFVVIIVALTVLLALRYMLLTRRSLCHPRSSFGRGLMVATGLFAALHFVNIGTHFLSFVPSMQHWVNDYGVHFNRVLLTATVAFGYMSAALNLIFAMMLLFWRDKDAEALDRVALTHTEDIES
ncbi:g9633 [Coccomyxa viridis]|uniref:G9633 protein n=1 Tax=Coccomyxa viridis TaxID=1274662 RepID=A0ABP1G380_9CHLO